MSELKLVVLGKSSITSEFVSASKWNSRGALADMLSGDPIEGKV